MISKVKEIMSTMYKKYRDDMENIINEEDFPYTYKLDEAIECDLLDKNFTDEEIASIISENYQLNDCYKFIAYWCLLPTGEYDTTDSLKEIIYENTGIELNDEEDLKKIMFYRDLVDA